MFFLDIDHVPADSPIVKETDERLGTYAETSQSGNGVHFYGYINIDKLPISKDNGKIRLDKKYYQKHPTNGMELYFGYFTNRYAAFTGNAFNESELKGCAPLTIQLWSLMKICSTVLLTTAPCIRMDVLYSRSTTEQRLEK